MSFSASYLGSSGWFIVLNGVRILIDPWLKGDLFFSPGPWLINGKLKNEIAVPNDIDALLLTQGLADHAHEDSLKLLDRSIPVIASSSGSNVVNKLGFKETYSLRPNQKIELNNSLLIEATAGAYVPLLENGYIVSVKNTSFYIEPHGFLDGNIKSRNINTVITPVINLRLPIFGDFIKGKSVLPQLIKTFNPKNILSSTTGGDASFTGLLNNFIQIDGSPEESFKDINNEIKCYQSIAGDTYYLN